MGTLTPGKTVLIKAKALYDPERGLLGSPVLRIKDNVILSVSSGPAADDAALPVLDLSRYTICAPFCDYHLHFRDDSPEAARLMAGALRSHGVLSVHEGGSRSMRGFQMQEFMKGSIDVHVAGCALFRRGTYGTPLGTEVASVEEGKEAISRLHDRGVSYIKLINSGILDPRSGEISDGGFREQDLSGMIAHARARGLPVFCHANGDPAIRAAVNAGASAIIHGFSVSEETLILMKERSVSLIPTVLALSSLSALCRSPEERRRLSSLVSIHMEAVRKAWQTGVRLLVGTDAGAARLPYGTSYAGELLLFAQSGIPPEEILRASVTGPLYEGSRATFLALDGLSVKAVFMDGREIVSAKG